MEQYPHLDLGLETQSVHTLDELERSDALSYLGKISVGDVQVHVRHESANFSSSAFPTRHRMHLFFPRPQSSVPKRDWFHSAASPCPRKLSLLSVPYSLPVFAQSSIKARIFLASNNPQSYHDTPYNHRPDVDLHLLPSPPKKKKEKKTGDVIWVRQQKALRLRRFNKEISRCFESARVVVPSCVAQKFIISLNPW